MNKFLLFTILMIINSANLEYGMTLYRPARELPAPKQQILSARQVARSFHDQQISAKKLLSIPRYSIEQVVRQYYLMYNEHINAKIIDNICEEEKKKMIFLKSYTNFLSKI